MHANTVNAAAGDAAAAPIRTLITECRSLTMEMLAAQASYNLAFSAASLVTFDGMRLDRCARVPRCRGDGYRVCKQASL